MATSIRMTAAAVAVAACVVGTVSGGFALAAPPAKVVKQESSESGAGKEGMRVYVDPETGQTTSRPISQADAAALDSAFPEDYSKIQEIHKADGSTEWIFNGQVDSALVAKRGADGKLEVVCAEHGVVHDHLKVQPLQGARDDR